MKTMNFIFLMIIACFCFADNPEWIVYNSSNSIVPDVGADVKCILIDEDGTKWFGTSQGLIEFDGTNWRMHNTNTSQIPSSMIWDMAFDPEGNLWVVTAGIDGNGFAKFDGTDWTVYSSHSIGFPAMENHFSAILFEPNGTMWLGAYAQLEGGLLRLDTDGDWTLFTATNTNYGLLGNRINDLSRDSEGNIWASTVGPGPAFPEMAGGISKFDGENWTAYQHSDLPFQVDPIHSFPDYSLLCDSMGNIWVSKMYPWSNNGYGGLAKYDGDSWEHYYHFNSGLPNDTVKTIAEDNYGNIWTGHHGTYGGTIGKFDGEDWTEYSSFNSGLPENAGIQSLAFDQFNNLYIGTWHAGLVIFNPDGVVSSDQNLISPPNIRAKNYPNPFNPETTIEFSISADSHISIDIYNVKGNKVSRLSNAYYPVGTHSVLWNGRDDNGKVVPSGIYFAQIKSQSETLTHKMLLLK